MTAACLPPVHLKGVVLGARSQAATASANT